jgi:hypothetical protein
LIRIRLRLLPIAMLAVVSGAACAGPYNFSSGSVDGKMAVAARIPSAGSIEIEAADDFVLATQTSITTVVLTGLLPSGSTAADVAEVALEIYRVFPLDSTTPASGQVPTRTNSPSDVAFASRDSAAATVSFTVTLVNPGYFAANSVVNGIHPFPNQTTGGEGPVSGGEVFVTATMNPQLVLNAGHYFLVPKVLMNSGTFLWLSVPKPIVAPGDPFAGDLQSWVRNADLDPDWLRIGTDIVGSGSFNQAFTLAGTDDIIFRDGFD